MGSRPRTIKETLTPPRDRPRRGKPTASEETARVLHIARMIDEEIRAIVGPPQGIIVGPDTQIIGPSFDILAVAERIAARTEGI